MIAFKKQFLLDPDVIFLNHGSFGATPQPVFATYQAWQRQLERQPVQFLMSELSGHLRAAREALGEYVGADADDLVFVPNATHGVNIVARSLDLNPGDEVLASTHEYGACNRAWRFISQKKGFIYRQQAIPLPVTTAEAVVEQFWQGVTARTRAIFLSHITSPTAMKLPVTEITERARSAGILTVVDGAHAPGQIPVNVSALGADFYSGNLHKWLCAPKGAGFLYARRECQAMLEPLIVSWGWQAEEGASSGSDFLDFFQWTGTADPAAYLAVPAAIQFQNEHDWTAVRRRCRRLVRRWLERMQTLTGLAPLYPIASDFYSQMASARLPSLVKVAAFKSDLYHTYRVEIPCLEWQGQPLVRISVQAYNTASDIDAAIEAIGRALAAMRAVHGQSLERPGP